MQLSFFRKRNNIPLPHRSGWDKNNLEKPNADNSYGYAHPGDTPKWKYCNIDKATYNFWNTWEFAWASYGNPFPSPVKVIGNISNGALGAFRVMRHKTKPSLSPGNAG